MTRSFYYGFLFVLVFLQAPAQDKKVDSLKHLLRSVPADSNKAKTFLALGHHYYDTDEYGLSSQYADSALSLSQKMNFLAGVSESNCMLGMSAYRKGDFPLALKHYYTALPISEKLDDKKGTAQLWSNLGVVYIYQSNFPEALKCHREALRIRLELNDKKSIAESYNNLGATYKEMGNYEEALRNHFLALGIRQEIGYKRGIAYSLHNIAAVYLIQEKYAEALNNELEVIRIRKETGDRYNTCATMIVIAQILQQEKKPGLAIRYLDSSLIIAKQLGARELIANTYQGLAAADSMRGDLNNAFDHYKQSVLYNDTLNNEENTRNSVRIQMRYEFNQKQAADSVRTAEEKRVSDAELKGEQVKRYGLYGGLFLLLAFAGFLFNRWRITQRQKKMIEDQKMIVDEQKKVIEEKTKDILDSIYYARRIQRALLPTEKYIVACLDRIKKQTS
jgi:tetratricopeptide (TPR) repeat protein